jgi:hypothetical protein
MNFGAAEIHINLFSNCAFRENLATESHNLFKNKVIDKIHPPRGGTFSLTSALDGSGWLTPRTGRFTPKKWTRYQFYRRLRDSHGQSRCVL